MEGERNGGRFDAEYPDEAFLDALDAEGGSAGSGDVAGQVGCSRRTATRRLSELANNGRVSRQSVGNATLWTINDT